MPGIGTGISPMLRTQPSSGGASLLQSWYDLLSVKPSEGLWTDLNNLADTLNAAGKFTKFDGLIIHAGLETDEQRKTPLIYVGGTGFSFVNGSNFVTDGYQGNGTNQYIETGYIPASHGVNFVLNDAEIGVWIHQEKTTNGNYISGVDNGVPNRVSSIGKSGTTFATAVNGSSLNIASAPSMAGYVSARNPASNQVKINLNGVDVATGSNPVNGVLATRNLRFAANMLATTGATSVYSDGIVRAHWYGSADLSEDADVYNALSTFWTARGL